MSSVILDLVKLNEKMDYTILIPLAIIYVLVFWLIVSGWVGYDANKRFNSRWKAYGFAILNLFFGLPFTILYMLTKPIEEINENDYEEEQDKGGINIPVINFVGKDGVVMALELKINSPKLATEKTPEMKIDVSFNPQEDEHLKIAVEQPEINNAIVVDNLEKQTLISKVEEGDTKKFSFSLAQLFKKLKVLNSSKEKTLEIKSEPTEIKELIAEPIIKSAQINQYSKKRSKKKQKKRR